MQKPGGRIRRMVPKNRKGGGQSTEKSPIPKAHVRTRPEEAKSGKQTTRASSLKPNRTGRGKKRGMEKDGDQRQDAEQKKPHQVGGREKRDKIEKAASTHNHKRKRGS